MSERSERIEDPRRAYDLTGRVAVITGAGSGIGRATSLALAAVGATVVCADIAKEAAEATAADIGDSGGTATVAVVDTSDRASVDDLVGGAVGAHGRLDIMGNIAGIMREAPVVDLTDEELDLVLGINLKGVLYGCAAAGRVMVEQGSGSIVNMASGAIDTPAPKLAAYAIAKAGVAQLTRTFATEVARNGVRVNAVAPGFVMTGMTKRHWTDEAGNEDPAKRAQVEKGFGSFAPLGRVGDPMDIAHTVVFLASDASSFMTGQILRPNGGVAMPW